MSLADGNFAPEVDTGPMRLPPKSKWERWFAWHPVKINGKTIWGRYVYRRYDIWRDERERDSVEYGTILDVLRNDDE